jgi:hypothetical protein
MSTKKIVAILFVAIAFATFNLVWTTHHHSLPNAPFLDKADFNAYANNAPKVYSNKVATESTHTAIVAAIREQLQHQDNDSLEPELSTADMAELIESLTKQFIQQTTLSQKELDPLQNLHQQLLEVPKVRAAAAAAASSKVETNTALVAAIREQLHHQDYPPHQDDDSLELSTAVMAELIEYLTNHFTQQTTQLTKELDPLQKLQQQLLEVPKVRAAIAEEEAAAAAASKVETKIKAKARTETVAKQPASSATAAPAIVSSDAMIAGDISLQESINHNRI